MYKQMAGAVLSCFCATAMANHGFEPIAALAPETAGARAVAVGDVTGDGRDDVLVLAGGSDPFYQNTVILYAQIPGGFAPAVAIAYHPEPNSQDAVGASIALSDLDADGDRDIVVSHGNGSLGWLTVLRNDGAGFTPGTAPLQESLAAMKFMDVDGDGHTDLVGQSIFGPIVVVPGDGSAGFGVPVWMPADGFPLTFQLADLDNDGTEDLIYRFRDRAYVRYNDGGGFSPTPRMLLKTSFSTLLSAADFNADHRVDLMTLTHTLLSGYSLILYPQDSNEAYHRKVFVQSGPDYPGLSLQAGDLNADGRQDLAVLDRSYESKLEVTLARTNGGFDFPASYEVGRARDFVLGDVNDDGLPDVLVIGTNGSVTYMLARDSARGVDLAVFLGLTDGAAAVHIENRGNTSSASYRLDLDIEPRRGSAIASDIPEGCNAHTVWGGRLRISCPMPALAAGTQHVRAFPFNITAVRTPLTATAHLEHAASELRKGNNVSRKMIYVGNPD